jgi:hypothetical protein
MWTIRCDDGYIRYALTLEDARRYAHGFRVAAIVQVLTPTGEDGWDAVLSA